MSLQSPARPAAAVKRLSPANAWLKALEMTAPIVTNPTRTLPVVVDELAIRHRDAPALVSNRECFSFRDLAARTNRYARWALEQGIGIGDRVCLLMPNRPEYAAIWLGISRVGGIVSLLNTNLRGDALAHCARAVQPRHALVDSALADTWAAALPLVGAKVETWVHGACGRDFKQIDSCIAGLAGTALDASERREVTVADRALHIYTSGTTGLPKAAHVSHHRVMQWAHWFAGMMDTRPGDRLYNCLPMYHSIGGVVAVGAPLVGGGAVVIRERFSARDFWSDVVAQDCTLFQYIGELCRYLVNAEPHAQETSHRLRLCAGNGLRPDVWEGFANRFQIPQILEFYAATEGNFSLFNCEGKPGAIGRIPTFLSHRFKVAIVRVDEDGSEPVRNADGFCVPCAVGEAGEAIGEVRGSGAGQAGRFEGYTDEAASKQKIICDVFANGDVWVRSGDLMRKDDKGFFYFVDRAGDTFRWKGENVATTEVAEVISRCEGVNEVTVYGVAVPGAEGRAGMAALVVDQRFDPANLRRHLVECLPGYAVPLFVRICPKMEVTTTFRPKKRELAHAGYDPATTADPIYFNDATRGEFVPLDAELYRRIRAGTVRL